MIIASRFPLGFLDLVGAQNFGENPRQLSEVVVPVVDIGEQYLATLQVLVAGSNGALANGFNTVTVSAEFTVPAGETWRLLSLSASIAAGPGITGTFAPAVRQTNTGGARATLCDGMDFAASRTTWTHAIATPLWLTAGNQMGIEVQNLAGGNPPGSVVAIYSRLRA